MTDGDRSLGDTPYWCTSKGAAPDRLLAHRRIVLENRPRCAKVQPAVWGLERFCGREIAPNLRLVRELGRGGMSVLWAAEHRRLKNQVVVKFLSDDVARHAAPLTCSLRPAWTDERTGTEDFALTRAPIYRMPAAWIISPGTIVTALAAGAYHQGSLELPDERH